MGIKHAKNWARIMCRANVPGFMVGGHGIGKTSAIYQMYQETAEEKKRKGLSEDAVVEILDRNGVDIKVLSSLDGKHLARVSEDMDAYGFWSMSAPNISIEEIIGMPHVEDRGVIYREAWYRSQDAAATMLAKGGYNEDKFTSLTESIFKNNCERLGITEKDRNDIVLRYLRLYGLMPDPRHRGGGVWLIDELNRGFQEVEKAMMQILLERRYLDYVVPDDVWICTTMNPPGGEYQVREMDAATLDRGGLISLRPDKTEWLAWATSRGVGENSRVFVEKHDNIINMAVKEMSLDDVVNPGTYRSVEWCDRAFRVMHKEEVSETGLAVAVSLLGPEAGTLYYKEFTENIHRPLTAFDVVDKYGWKESMSHSEVEDYEAWKPTKVRSRLKSMINKTNVKTELLHVTLAEIKVWLQEIDKSLEERGSTKNNPKHTPKEKGQILNLILFLHDIPPDISRTFIMDDIDTMFFRVMYFSGKYPVSKSLFKKVETGYKEQQSKDES